MLKGDWRGGFTVGLTVGILAVVLLLISLDGFSPAIDPPTGSQAHCGPNQYHCADNYEQVPDRWYWLRRAFSIEDSIAQWLMMAFTIVAAFLLLATLRETRTTGQAQVRAYLTLDKVTATYISTETPSQNTIHWHVEFIIHNSGQTPARKVWCKADIITPNAEAKGETTFTFDVPGNRDGPHKVRCDTDQIASSFEAGLVDDVRFDLQCQISVGFTDVFGIECGPFQFLYGGTRNYSRLGAINALTPIHKADD